MKILNLNTILGIVMTAGISMTSSISVADTVPFQRDLPLINPAIPGLPVIHDEDVPPVSAGCLVRCVLHINLNASTGHECTVRCYNPSQNSIYYTFGSDNGRCDVQDEFPNILPYFGEICPNGNWNLDASTEILFGQNQSTGTGSDW